MDLLITAAAYALAASDPLRALGRVALRDHAPALALRGIRKRSLAPYLVLPVQGRPTTRESDALHGRDCRNTL